MAKFLFTTNRGNEFTVEAATMTEAEREFETPDKDGNMLLEDGERLISRRQVSANVNKIPPYQREAGGVNF